MHLVKIGVHVDCGPGLKVRSSVGWDCLHRPVGLVQTMEVAMYLICLPLSFWPSGPQQLFYVLLPSRSSPVQSPYRWYGEICRLISYLFLELSYCWIWSGRLGSGGLKGPQTTPSRSCNPGVAILAPPLYLVRVFLPTPSFRWNRRCFWKLFR